LNEAQQFFPKKMKLVDGKEIPDNVSWFLVHQNVQNLAQDFRMQVLSKSPILMAALLKRTNTLEEFNDREAEITEIYSREGPEWNPVYVYYHVYTNFSSSKFYTINALHSKPWSIVSASTPTDCFVIMTETTIINSIDPVLLQRYTGKGIKQWLTNGNRGMREPKSLCQKYLVKWLRSEISSKQGSYELKQNCLPYSETILDGLLLFKC
jgi:hypothetical protein